MSLIEKVHHNIETEQLLDEGNVVVVAVSGGPDSVALLHILFLLSERYRWRLVVAHVNHQFRGEESDDEADFVARLAKGWGLPCEIGVIDVPAYISEMAMNSQVAAREKRYEFLHTVAKKYAAQRIALAHHADDQAETIMMRIIRGTGPSGLKGMPERRTEKKVELIRPFIRIYKSDIIEHCLHHGLAYCEDSSNEQRKYFRNKVRLDIMPMLRSYNEQLPESLNRLAEMMRAEDDYMEEAAKQAFSGIVTASSLFLRFSRVEFARLHVALQRRLIKLILNYLALGLENVDYARVEQLRAAILQEQTSNLKLDIMEHLCLVREYDEIRFQMPSVGTAAYSYPVMLLNDEQLYVPSADVKIDFAIYKPSEAGRQSISPSANSCIEAFFDLDLLELPLTVRNRAEGDRIQPHGLNGTKKVKDMFIDAKIPPSKRDAVPLVVDAKGRVIWIPRLRISKHAPVGPDTVHVVHMKLLS